LRNLFHALSIGAHHVLREKRPSGDLTTKGERFLAHSFRDRAHGWKNIQFQVGALLHPAQRFRHDHDVRRGAIQHVLARRLAKFLLELARIDLRLRALIIINP
jgi:hypothetical protein